MPILTFADGKRRIDYERLFQPRVTPEWMRMFEQQVLDECLADLSYFDDPIWRRVFEIRVAAYEQRRGLC